MPMSDWLTDHLRRETRTANLKEFAECLADRLNAEVPQAHQARFQSGFHIAGFGASGRVEFWFVRNVEDDRVTCTGRYDAREDFQRRDAAALVPGAFQTYRNGDLLPHVLLWETLDNSLAPLLNRPDFRRVRTPEDYQQWVVFKMEVIAHVYKRFSIRPLIGRPIDAFYVSH